jgi:flagellar protein FliS
VSAYAPSSPAAYQQQAILTAPPERLVVMLYDGALRFLFQAAVAMREDKRALTDEKLRRGEAIIDHLIKTLDMSAGEIAENLEGIYVFCKRLLMEARLESDAGKIQKVRELLGELRESWAQIAGVTSA